jgi:hypothetical protein
MLVIGSESEKADDAASSDRARRRGIERKCGKTVTIQGFVITLCPVIILDVRIEVVLRVD